MHLTLRKRTKQEETTEETAGNTHSWSQVTHSTETAVSQTALAWSEQLAVGAGIMPFDQTVTWKKYHDE